MSLARTLFILSVCLVVCSLISVQGRPSSNSDAKTVKKRSFSMQDFVDFAEGRDVRQPRPDRNSTVPRPGRNSTVEEEQEWLKANPIAWTKDRSELKNKKSN